MQTHRSALHPITSTERGNSVLLVLGMIAVVSMLFTSVLTRTMTTNRNVSHIASWQEALVAADAGGELAMSELRKTISKTADVNAFAGWDLLNPDGTKIETIAAGTGKTVIKKLVSGRALRIAPPKLAHGG